MLLIINIGMEVWKRTSLFYWFIIVIKVIFVNCNNNYYSNGSTVCEFKFKNKSLFISTLLFVTQFIWY